MSQILQPFKCIYVAVHVIFEHSRALIKFSISFKLSVRDWVWYRTNENTFRLLVIFSIPEILKQVLLTPESSKSPFRRVEISQFWDVCFRLYNYQKNLTFIPVIHTLCFFRNMVEKFKLSKLVKTTESKIWAMLTVSARSRSSGKTKTIVSQNSDLLWQLIKVFFFKKKSTSR